jgi:hypothetical protein
VSRRKRARLIERDDSARAGYPAATQAFSTRGYGDPINAYAYATPAYGVGTGGHTPNRGTTGAYGHGPIGAFGAMQRNFGSSYNTYNPASGRAHDATDASGAFSVVRNPNGPINEAGGAFSTYNAASTGVYNTYQGVSPTQVQRPPYGRYR